MSTILLRLVAQKGRGRKSTLARGPLAPRKAARPRTKSQDRPDLEYPAGPNRSNWQPGSPRLDRPDRARRRPWKPFEPPIRPSREGPPQVHLFWEHPDGPGAKNQ